MKLKPKSSVHNNRALLYRRYTDIEKSVASNFIYKTQDNKVWQFNTENKEFIAYQGTSTTTTSIDNGSYLKYLDKYFVYNSGWTSTTTQPQAFNLAQFPQQQKYQLNKYYYVGSFDYMMKGGIDTEDIQYIKGNIIPTQTFNIKWFNDDMKIDHDDLVVINDRLYMVNSVSYDIKRMPKPYKVYFGTLSSIL